LGNLRQHLARDGGYTAIELAVVVTLSAIVLGIGATAYAGFGDRAARVAGRSNIRTAIPAAVAYNADYGNYSFTRL
jgi:prepilin-type N-terminal cleavage/methylation domain-containing protein